MKVSIKICDSIVNLHYFIFLRPACVGLQYTRHLCMKTLPRR